MQASSRQLPRLAVAAAAMAAGAALVLPRAQALERPSHEDFQSAAEVLAGTDKCMKRLWPDLADPCPTTSMLGSCKARVGHLASGCGGSCDQYCSSFGFQCVAGYVPEASSSGCGTSSSETYFGCSETTQSEEAICQCADRMDTFLWTGAAKLCGSGRALVSNASSCDDYCGAQGLQCAGAERQPSSGAKCSGGTPVSCFSPLSGADAVCTCSGSYDRSGAFKWPDKEELCGTTAVLVSGQALERNGGTCSGYCRSLRQRVPGYDLYFFCYGAWHAKGAGCGAYELAGSSTTCDEDMKGDNAVCACSFADL